MKFKIGDEVRIMANKKQLKKMYVNLTNLTGAEGKIVGTGPHKKSWFVDCGEEYCGRWWIFEKYLELIAGSQEQPKPVNSTDTKKDVARKVVLHGQNGLTKPTNPKNSLGIKKAPLSTMPTGPMYEVALAMLEGARKYGRHNYRVMGVKASVYYDAAMGHMTAFWEGEDIDTDSGLHHLAKAQACLAVLRDSMMMGNWVDDRPPKYPDASKLMRNHPAVKDILNKYPDCVEPYTEENKNDR